MSYTTRKVCYLPLLVNNTSLNKNKQGKIVQVACSFTGKEYCFKAVRVYSLLKL